MGMSATYHISAIICVLSSTAFIISAIATHQWIRGCIYIDDVISAIKRNETVAVKNDENFPPAFLKMRLCISQGLVSATMTIHNLYRLQMPVNFMALDVFVRVAVSFLGLAMSSAVFCTILLIIAVSAMNSTYQRKNIAISRTRVSMIFAFVSGILSMVGMSVYAGCTKKMLNDPVLYIQQTESYILSSFSSMEESVAQFAPFGAEKTTRQQAEEMFGLMRPVYDYSFVFGWVGFFGFIISTLMIFFAHKSMTSQPNTLTHDKL